MAGRLHTTTARFHADTWATIVAESRRLGIPHAEYIRGAVVHYEGYRSGLEHRGLLERRLEWLERHVRRFVAWRALVDHMAAQAGRGGR